MTERVYGVDKQGKKIWERPAREYDKSISNTAFGITIGDLIKAVPVIVACALFYANGETFKKNQIAFNQQVLTSVDNNARAVGGIKDVLWNLNNYLSASTGKQFRDGRPI